MKEDFHADFLETCRFCNLINNHNLKGGEQIHIPIYDQILYETANFFVIPALGSFVPGYIMIVSRNHIYSMAYLSNDEIEELLNLIALLRNTVKEKFSISPIIFEHGSAIGCFDKAANSVDHAHIHIVPIHITEETGVLRDASAFEIPDLKTIVSFKGEPYFLYVNEKWQHHLSHKTILPSQYMRKCIAKEIGCPLEWDWRQHEFLDNINTTVNLLSDVLCER